MKKQKLTIMSIYPNGIDFTIAVQYGNNKRDVLFASNPQEAIARLNDTFDVIE